MLADVGMGLFGYFEPEYEQWDNLRLLLGSAKKFHDFKSIQGKPLLSLINEFLLASKYRKIDILTLLLK